MGRAGDRDLEDGGSSLHQPRETCSSPELRRGPRPALSRHLLRLGTTPGVLVAPSHGQRTLGEGSLRHFPKPLGGGPRIGNQFTCSFPISTAVPRPFYTRGN